ncbi:Lecithin-cholesterol acyltransferase-like 1 [Linum perenne]
MDFLSIHSFPLPNHTLFFFIPKFNKQLMKTTTSSLQHLGCLIAAALTAMILPYTCQSAAAGNLLHPLILVPGAGGNQLEAKLTSDYKPSTLTCSLYPLVKQKGGWFRIWFDPTVLLSTFTRCFAERMMLHYDKKSDDFRNAPGVETRVSNFGSTDSLLCLDPTLNSLKEMGYVDGETLFGAPYDFRYGLAAQGHSCAVGSKFLADLKDLIEKASTNNGGKPVIIMSHSLGGLFVLQLLIRNSPSWVAQFVKHFIALSAPWGGTVDGMLTFASGNTLGVPLVDPLLVRGEQRSSESNLWLLPNPKLFGERPLVITSNGNYSAYQIEEFLDAIGFPEGVYPYKTRTRPLIEEFVGTPPPVVPITCVIGTGVDTAEALVYGKGFDERPSVVYGDGDGTVNMVSLLALETLWSSSSSVNQKVKVIKLSGISHASILNDEVSIREIVAEISSLNTLALSDL